MSITDDPHCDFAELTIDQTWDGQPIAKSRHIYLRLMPGPWDPEIWQGTAPLDAKGAPATAIDDLEIGESGLYLRLEAPFHGDPPPDGPPGPTPRLWHHEVVELFIVGSEITAPGDAGTHLANPSSRKTPQDKTPQDKTPQDKTPYIELEMSPWGHYLFLRLAGVRQVVESGLCLPYRARRSHSVWWGEAFLPERWLPPLPWRANAFALHDGAEERQHLAAIAVPGALPDFHRLSLFPALVLPTDG